MNLSIWNKMGNEENTLFHYLFPKFRKPGVIVGKSCNLRLNLQKLPQKTIVRKPLNIGESPKNAKKERGLIAVKDEILRRYQILVKH